MTTINPYTPYVGGAFASQKGSESFGTQKTDRPAQPSVEPGSAIAEFLKYQKMTPEQKLRDSILKKMGLTEEGLSLLSAEDRKAIEKEIKQAMKDMIENNMAEKGMLVDITV